jgi:hypothetical protein
VRKRGAATPVRAISRASRAGADVLRTAPFLDLSQFEGIMFDVDGTLTHSDDMHFQAFQELLQDKGFNGAGHGWAFLVTAWAAARPHER